MIEIRELVKTFGAVRALDGVSFHVEAATIFGLIGPNGAGKTTCLNILSTLLKPTAGSVRIDGLAVDQDVREIRRRLGYMPDFFGVYRNLTAWEYLDFFGGACGLARQRRHVRIEAVLAQTRLLEKRDELVDNLSRGMKQRLCLAKALIHEPRLLVLDEPASGLDPRARIEIRELIREAARQGTTVLISSHVLSELGDLCTHVGILEQGRLRQYGPLAEVLRAARPGRRWRLEVGGDADAAATRLAGVPGLAEIARPAPGVLVLHLDENVLAAAGRPADRLPPEVLKALSDGGIDVRRIQEDRPGLEDAFLRFTEGGPG